MKAAALVPVEEYLRTAYSPDCDYVDGEVLERNFGERDHSEIRDYLNFGVRYVWVVDPSPRRAWVYTKTGIREVTDGILQTENPTLTVPLAEIFAGIDED